MNRDLRDYENVSQFIKAADSIKKPRERSVNFSKSMISEPSFSRAREAAHGLRCQIGNNPSPKYGVG